MDINKLNEEFDKKIRISPFCDKRIIFGQGPLNPDIALVGEAPGAEEEKLGQPFVGKAGKNLNEFLDIIGLKREDIYITNAVKLRPSKVSPKTGRLINRTPDKEEIEFFNSFLHDELKAISPKFVVTLGNTPLNAIIGEKMNIGNCHGKIVESRGFRVFALYHPAAVIYNQSLKDVYISDIKALGELLEKEKA